MPVSREGHIARNQRGTLIDLNRLGLRPRPEGYLKELCPSAAQTSLAYIVACRTSSPPDLSRFSTMRPIEADAERRSERLRSSEEKEVHSPRC